MYDMYDSLSCVVTEGLCVAADFQRGGMLTKEDEAKLRGEERAFMST